MYVVASFVDGWLAVDAVNLAGVVFLDPSYDITHFPLDVAYMIC